MKKAAGLAILLLIFLSFLPSCRISQDVYKKATDDLAISQAQVLKLQSDLNSCQGELSKAQSQILNLQNNLNKAQSQVDTLQKLSDTFKSQTDSLQKALDASKSQIESIQKVSDSYKSQAESLQKSLNDSQAQVQTLQTNLTTAQSNLAKVQAQIQTINKAAAYADFLDLVFTPVWVAAGLPSKYNFSSRADYGVAIIAKANALQDSTVDKYISQLVNTPTDPASEMVMYSLLQYCLQSISRLIQNTQIVTPTTTTTPTTTVPVTTTVMTLRGTANITSFDPYFSPQTNIDSAWMERLHTDDWTLNPTVFDYKTDFRPSEYMKGQLAESWEFTDPSTYVVHLRRGIYWQNKPPVNGREFTASDVVYHYHRLFGGGDGFAAPAPYWGTVVAYKYLTSITASDKYTVIFKWSISNPTFIMETMQSLGVEHCIMAREAVDQYGNLTEWRNAVGTGPFILTDYVSGISATLTKNPGYWGYDERYPQDKLPYIDQLRYIIIPDKATAIAAMRTGKIEALDGVTWEDAKSIQNTNPQILQVAVPAPSTLTVDPRNDKVPFNDIRIRKAMQMALDLPTIASAYYGNTVELYPSTLTANEIRGCGWPYDRWSQELKDEYAFNAITAKSLLVAAGYPNGFKTNIVVPSTSDINLLQMVKSYFAAIGIDMEIRIMTSTSWNAFVLARNHDQLVWSTAGSLGLTYGIIRQLKQFETGYSSNWLMVNDPTFNSFYSSAIATTSVDQVKQLVRDANEYVARQHFAISLLKPRTFALYQPWLNGYIGQNNSISGGSLGPGLLGFYTARFQINQNLKKSMGY